MSMWARPLDTCMMDIRFREKFQDALAVVISDEERAGLDILTHGDFHCDEDFAGRSWHHYPLQRWTGFEGDYLQSEETRSPWLKYPPGTLLNEIYTALHGECLSLAAMGVRALLERVMIDRVGDHDSFAENLKAFADKGYVAAHQSDILKATLDVGHASIHRNYTPTLEDIRLALDITENVIEMVYVSHEQAAELKRRTPPRK